MVGKPKGESKETYEALLDAAEQTFAERGVTRTTLNDVACSAGMTRGAVYWHFKDKGALVEALCDRVFLPMETMLNEITAAPEDDPIAALRGMMLEMLTQTATNPRQKAVFDILFHHCEKNDEMAFFANEKEKRGECLGIAVPGQLSVVGFDNIPESVLAEPSLTTVQQPIRRMGQEATEMLLALISGQDVHDLDRTLDTSLVLRSSTAPPGQAA